MPGNNLPLVLPPGINSDVSRYTAKLTWWDGNLVRWNDQGVLQPVGGWVKLYALTGSTNPVREMFSWVDNNAIAFAAFGTLDKAIVRNTFTSVNYNAEPLDLVFVPSGAVGFGSGSFGNGRFGLDSSNNSGGGTDSKFRVGYWTFDNWGQNLIGVHSNDGRLLQWDPTAPATRMSAVSGAPTGNRLCITTDERHVMVMGGNTSPRRIKWCSREDITTWTASSTNSAGGWDLDTNGIILAAVKVPQGVLVLTDVDVHIIEYVGPPSYYSRRLVTDETGVVAPKAAAAMPNGAIFAGHHAFWSYNGGVSKIPCSLSDEVFKKGNLEVPLGCFMGVNEAFQEIWFFYPNAGGIEASKYVMFRYAEGQRWWSKGNLVRTAWLNPVWSSLPMAASSLNIYEHERGWTDDGSSRQVFAESGAFEIGGGDNNMAVSRIFHDTILPSDYVSGDPVPYTLTFKLARAPQGPETTYGPVTLNPVAGYTTLRFKTRQASVRLTETIIPGTDWGLGKSRLKVKPVGGGR